MDCMRTHELLPVVYWSITRHDLLIIYLFTFGFLLSYYIVFADPGFFEIFRRLDVDVFLLEVYASTCKCMRC